ncbi:1,6-anhydro-N-acetylmuramyl-L-alanine amidase AmpD [Marinobacter lipolyticus]|uniref:1,6-anhydro-N-acetylmuramyl-L-alanine amidase AmpD n=1 Tax=Marinobacter lipolyticus TaxID=209639 RepID=UPI001BCE1A50|nr:1,6-anhydro-N-acetylmuramyl-L-alanine amidase AmpD [Marinobacter lipolyticus]
MPDSIQSQSPAPCTSASIDRLRRSGRVSWARWCPSPNFGPRPENADISLLVVHNISLPPGQFGGDAIERFFCNSLDACEHPYFETIAGMKVSAHALVRRDGTVVQFVSFLDRAWHAGRSCFQGEDECNDFSIGIELEGADDIPYTPEQYQSLAALSALAMSAWPRITRDRITGHCDIAPGRKTDPGPAFDWAHYHQQLLALGADAGEPG